MAYLTVLVAATGTKCGALAAAAEALKADGVALALVHESALMGCSHAVYAARHVIPISLLGA